MQFLQNYLEALQDISTQDKEHTYRTPLENLLNALKGESKAIHIKHEPNNDKEGRGAPDFLITKDSLTLGYIENKRVNADLDSISQSPQIEKYLRLSDNLMLTDYLRFCLVRKNDKGNAEIVQECRICELSQLQALVKNPKLFSLDSKAKELTELFTLFFSQSPSPINTAKEFANALAQRTRILKDEMIENESNAHIQGLFNAFKESLYKDLDFITFADSFAQTLTYSLFLARLNNNANENITLDNAYNFIPKSFSLIQAMSKFLRELKELDSIKWLLEEIIAIINHIDIAAIIHDLNKLSQKDLLGEHIYKDPYLHLYEDFLKEYDESLREVRGVYYTPAPVVKFIIDSIDLTLQKDFNKQGLKSAITDDNITLLDFATGTGTFLLEAFRKALESSNKNSVKYNPKALIQRFYGFEFLIAPYTITHLKISQAFKEEFEAQLNDNESLNITLTNTLYVSSKEDEINKQSNLFVGMAELTKEFEKAQEIKSKDILIITGNPPYNALSINKYDISAYKYCGLRENNQTSKIPINEKKHRLNDDYIKFIRFAQNKIDNQDSGIIALITNNSFFDGVTMNGMRWNLLNSFDKIYLLNLHGDSNKHEVCPNGNKDENVFDIKQGVGISIFVKTKPKKNLSNTPKCEVFYYDLYGSRKFKYDFLYSKNLDSIKWQQLKPQNPSYEFFIQNDKLRKTYDKGRSLKDIFVKSGLGICTYRDFFCYANSKDEMMKRIDAFSKQTDEQSKIDFALEDSGTWSIRWAKQELLETKLDEKLIQKVHFKPFDFKYTYYTGKSSGFLGRPAGAVQNLMLQNNIGLVCYRTCGVNGLDNIFIANGLIDLHLVGSGSTIFPLKDSMQSENLNLEFRKFIDKHYKEHFSPEQILGYIYAVLFHKEYREKYLDFLKIDFPKIPFVESKEKFLEFSELGSSLISLHLLQDDALDSSIGEPLYNDKNDKNLIIEKPSYNAESQQLFINKSLYFDKVDSSVWEYKIGGYQVLDKYLKSHKGEAIDFTYFQKIIQTLHKSLEIESRIAAIEL
ncbi:DNA methyltransferase [Helicobacter cinaedi]|uniref:type ISP restriction/modification enzyme n=1 Tax=Helicobacter cinaedi TaxID=213 RepID=UPI001EEE6CD3|nr:type ISP restriction/modification enzyme [Helicobacter cinaedi]BDB66685.1 DNA methyltransferase [Helicobacter cinaedi]